jgi:hypothetical protein
VSPMEFRTSWTAATWRQARRRMLPGDVEGMIARMRIGPGPCLAVIFAFVDGVSFLQDGYGPGHF